MFSSLPLHNVILFKCAPIFTTVMLINSFFACGAVAGLSSLQVKGLTYFSPSRNPSLNLALLLNIIQACRRALCSYVTAIIISVPMLELPDYWTEIGSTA